MRQKTPRGVAPRGKGRQRGDKRLDLILLLKGKDDDYQNS